jgi:hypothetical protein
LSVVGSTFAPVLQIVPVVTGIDVQSTSNTQVTGQGFVEGNGTVWQIGSAQTIDTVQGAGPDVFSSGSANTRGRRRARREPCRRSRGRRGSPYARRRPTGS